MDFDLHIHSKYSFDSISDPKLILKIAKRKKLKAVAITDHNTIKGSLKASKENIEDIYNIIGCEMTTEEGDIIGLFLNDEIKSKDSLEVIEEIKAQDGIAILAHPFKGATIPNGEIIRKVDAIEVLNGRVSKKANSLAEDLAIKNGIPLTAGSDAHFYFEIGSARITINDVTDMEDVKRKILEGDVLISGIESAKCYRLMSGAIKIIKTKKLPKKLHKLLRVRTDR